MVTGLSCRFLGYVNLSLFFQQSVTLRAYLPRTPSLQHRGQFLEHSRRSAGVRQTESLRILALTAFHVIRDVRCGETVSHVWLSCIMDPSINVTERLRNRKCSPEAACVIIIHGPCEVMHLAAKWVNESVRCRENGPWTPDETHAAVSINVPRQDRYGRPSSERSPAAFAVRSESLPHSVCPPQPAC